MRDHDVNRVFGMLSRKPEPKQAGTLTPGAADGSSSGSNADEEIIACGPGLEKMSADPEYVAIAKIVRAYYRQEEETVLSDPQLVSDTVGSGRTPEEAAALFVLGEFPSGIVTPEFMQEISVGDLTGLIEAVYRNLAGKGPYCGDAAKSLVNMCDSLAAENDEAKWYYEQELKYLELAHSAGAIKDKHYRKLKKTLMDNPPD